MATMEEKMGALTRLMQDGILSAGEFARVVAALNGAEAAAVPAKVKSPLELQYDEVFSKHIINAFKSPASCKWPELTPEMVVRGTIKFDGRENQCTYIDTYIDAPKSYGALLRQKIKLVVDENGKITRALQELKTSGVTLLGILANAALKDSWGDICKL